MGTSFCFLECISLLGMDTSIYLVWLQVPMLLIGSETVAAFLFTLLLNILDPSDQNLVLSHQKWEQAC